MRPVPAQFLYILDATHDANWCNRCTRPRSTNRQKLVVLHSSAHELCTHSSRCSWTPRGVASVRRGPADPLYRRRCKTRSGLFTVCCQSYKPKGAKPCSLQMMRTQILVRRRRMNRIGSGTRFGCAATTNRPSRDNSLLGDFTRSFLKSRRGRRVRARSGRLARPCFLVIFSSATLSIRSAISPCCKCAASYVSSRMAGRA